jgi:hypothetical protein
MPDLKTELSKVLDEWNKPETPMTQETQTTRTVPHSAFTATNNVCRATFECIKYNPGSTRKEVVDSLTSKGYKASSTTTLIGQMIKQNHVRESKGVLFAVNDQYLPLKSAKAWAKLQAAKAAPRKHVELVSKSTGKVFNPRPAPVALPVEKEWSPNDVIAKLNVHQALALFKALRNILVG